MFKNYLKITLRNVMRYKGYSAINILGLAVGMACCILIMLYVRDEFSYDSHAEQSDRIYRIVIDISSAERGNINTARTPPPWAPVLASEFPEIEGYVRLRPPDVSWMTSYQPGNKKFYEKRFYFADASVFDFFNIRLVRGEAAAALAKPSSVVLTEAMARKYFGTEDPIGKSIRIDNSFDFTITGVMAEMPRNSHFHSDFIASFSTLYTIETGYGRDYGRDMRYWFPNLYTYVRLPAGYDIAALEEKLTGFIGRHHGDVLASLNVEMRASLQPLRSIHLRSSRDAEIESNSDIAYSYIFSAIALFVLTIACINFMNLATARSAARAREVGIRKAVGAHRTRLMLQFLGESVVMAILSLIVALGLVYLALPWFNNLSGKFLTIALTDVQVLLGILAIVVLVGFLSGSYPALFLSSFQPAVVLKGSSKSGPASNSSLRKILVVIQFAISIVFLVGTGIVSRQMSYMQNKNLGFDKEQVVIMSLGDPNQRPIFKSYKNRILQSPQVLAVTGLLSPPGGLIQPFSFRPEGAPEDETVIIDFFGVDHDFLDVLKIELVAGRSFSRDYATDSTQAFLLNEAAVKYLGWEDNAVGKEIYFGATMPHTSKIIGVVKDFHVRSLHSEIEPLAIGLISMPLYMGIRVAPGDFAATLAFLEHEWRAVYPNDPFQYSFLDEDFDNLYRTEKLRALVFRVFSVLAVFISCLGLLGLASFTTEQRTKEIGVRKVMGASVLGIMTLLTRDFFKLVAIACVIAWPIAYFVMQGWLENFAYSGGQSPLVYLFAALTAMAIAVLTVGYQAAKAALTNPADALQYE